jgi:hypothetical protein
LKKRKGMSDFVGLILQDAKKIPEFQQLEEANYTLVFVNVDPQNVDLLSLVKSQEIPRFISPITRKTENFKILSNDALLKLCIDIAEYVPQIWVYLKSIGVVGEIPKKSESPITFENMSTILKPYEFKVSAHYWISEMQKLVHNIDTAVRIAIKHMSRLALALIEVQDRDVAVQMVYTIMLNNMYIEDSCNTRGTDVNISAFLEYSKVYAQMLRDCQVDLSDVATQSEVYTLFKPLNPNIVLLNRVTWLSDMLEEIPNTSIQTWFQQMCFVGPLFTKMFSKFDENMYNSFGGPIEMNETLLGKASKYETDQDVQESLKSFKLVSQAIGESIRKGNRSQKDIPVFVKTVTDLLNGRELTNFSELNETIKKWTNGMDFETILDLIGDGEDVLYKSILKKEIEKLSLIEGRNLAVIQDEMAKAEQAVRIQEQVLGEFVKKINVNLESNAIQEAQIQIQSIKKAQSQLEDEFLIDTKKIQRLFPDLLTADYERLLELLIELDERQYHLRNLKMEFQNNNAEKNYTNELREEILKQDIELNLQRNLLEKYMYNTLDIGEKEEEDAVIDRYLEWYATEGILISFSSRTEFVSKSYEYYTIRINEDDYTTFRTKLDKWNAENTKMLNLKAKLQSRQSKVGFSRLIIITIILALFFVFVAPYVVGPFFDFVTECPAPILDDQGPLSGILPGTGIFNKALNFYARQATYWASDHGHGYAFSTETLLSRFKPYNIIMDTFTGASSMMMTSQYLLLMGNCGRTSFKTFWGATTLTASTLTALCFDDNSKDVWQQESDIFRNQLSQDANHILFDITQIYANARTSWQNDAMLALNALSVFSGTGSGATGLKALLSLRNKVVTKQEEKVPVKPTTKYIRAKNTEVQARTREYLPRATKTTQTKAKKDDKKSRKPLTLLSADDFDK